LVIAAFPRSPTRPVASHFPYGYGFGHFPERLAAPGQSGRIAALVLHDFVSPKRAAEQLDVNRETIYRLCARGELPHVRVGSVLRIDLGAYLARS